MKLHRHPSGLIYSEAFADYLRERQQSEGAQHRGEILSIDYVRCASGPQAGSHWYQIAWITAIHAPHSERREIGGVWIHLNKQARRALAKCGLDHDGEEVRILR